MGPQVQIRKIVALSTSLRASDMTLEVPQHIRQRLAAVINVFHPRVVAEFDFRL